MCNKILAGLITALAASGIIASIQVEKRVSMIEEKEITEKEYLHAINKDVKFILCKLGEESECLK